MGAVQMLIKKKKFTMWNYYQHISFIYSQPLSILPDSPCKPESTPVDVRRQTCRNCLTFQFFLTSLCQFQLASQTLQKFNHALKAILFIKVAIEPDEDKWVAYSPELLERRRE